MKEPKHDLAVDRVVIGRVEMWTCSKVVDREVVKWEFEQAHDLYILQWNLRFNFHAFVPFSGFLQDVLPNRVQTLDATTSVALEIGKFIFVQV